MGGVAFLFAGQGSQYPGMGRSLEECSPAARAVMETAERIRPGTREQCYSGPKELLTLTENTQPCLFCADLMAAEVLREQGITPNAVAGFSLGEIPALAFAGLLTREDAFRFVVRRSQAMSRCAAENPGGMLAVLKLENAHVERICRELGDCWPVNYNCPGQVAAACTEERIPALESAVKEAGGKAIRLAVSGGFHSPLMAGAARDLAEGFSDLSMHAGEMPVWSNTTAERYGDVSLLFRQVAEPVRWEQTILAMARDGIGTFIEVGPGKTLSGFVRKILPDAAILRVEDSETLNEAVLQKDNLV